MSNADKAQPGIVIELDRPRRFLFTLESMCAIENQIEKERREKVKEGEEIEPANILKDINWTNLNARDLSYLLWAGLLSDDETLTKKEASKLLDLFTLIKKRNEIAKAVKQAFPEISEAIDDFVNPTERTEANGTMMAQ